MLSLISVCQISTLMENKDTLHSHEEHKEPRAECLSFTRTTVNITPPELHMRHFQLRTHPHMRTEADQHHQSASPCVHAAGPTRTSSHSYKHARPDLPASVASRNRCWNGETNRWWHVCAVRAAPASPACPHAHAHTCKHNYQSCRCLSVREHDTCAKKEDTHALPVIQKTRNTWSGNCKVSPETNCSHFSSECTHARMHAHAPTFWFCFGFLPSSCIRCRQKVRFLRHPGMVMRMVMKSRSWHAEKHRPSTLSGSVLAALPRCVCRWAAAALSGNDPADRPCDSRSLCGTNALSLTLLGAQSPLSLPLPIYVLPL